MKFNTTFKISFIKAIFVLFFTLMNFNLSAQIEKMTKKKSDSLANKIISKPFDRFYADIAIVYPNLSRGILLNTERIAFQASATYDFTKKLSFGTWITTNLSSSATAYNEIDFALTYQVTPIFQVYLGDYYTPATKENEEQYGGYRTPFSDYNIYSAQVVEMSLFFDFNSKNIPIEFQWNTVIFGNDFKDVVKDSDGNVTSKKRAFSSYSEIAYNYLFKKIDTKFRPFVGAAVINDAGYYGYFRNGNTGFSFINVGLKITYEYKVFKNYVTPIFVKYTYNEDGNYNRDRTDLRYNFLSAGITFTIK